uniref:NADH-ubiquinone oxidoreductase chain 1 n=1 Tax=Cambarus robustus TaxID=1240928 RepID=A0A1L6V0E1_9EUCA|nr:NADH dehydrogenase subunit 1 [Cambarus robustus]APS87266.1 NADH dehydrogenase subunit 1 [Cambarus robustus]UZC55679.1 NADH dehydrogenase subunit 1 [Cambarus robustus]
MSLVMIVNYLILVICVLLGVAFITLLERKILGYIQIRKGPNKLGILGVLQPFSDAVKLFCKENMNLGVSNFLPYYMAPVFSLFISLVVWGVLPYGSGMFNMSLGVLFFMCCLSSGVYPMMMAGWASNCKYSLLGSLRSVAQTISYEVSLALILLSFIFLIESFNFSDFIVYQEEVWFLWLTIPLSMVWFTSSLAETNRTPFDFSEGESELVSGFNTEYSSGGFALIFMAEYSSILFMSMIFSLFFLGPNTLSIIFYMKVVGVSGIFIWVRGTLPRFRYDKLMYLAWKSFLPVSLNFLIWCMGMKVGFYSWFLVS